MVRYLLGGLLLVATFSICSPRVSYSMEPAAGKATTKANAAKKVGIDKRIPWTTSRVVGSPEPPDPYRVELAFSKLNFTEPLALERT